MKIYYERMIRCQCGFELRQTAEIITLDKLGKSMLGSHLNHYSKGVRCRQKLTFNSWRKIVPDSYYLKNLWTCSQDD